MSKPSPTNDPFIPHLHLESMLDGLPPQDRDMMIHQVDDILEYYSMNDLVTIHVDEDGNFYYYLTKKGVEYANEQSKYLF